MLIPRYSIRWLLGLTTFSAGVSLVLAHAVRGQAWAIATASGLWTLVVVALFLVVAFLFAWLIDQMFAGRHGGRAEGVSPFAGTQPTELPPPTVVRQTTDTPPAITG
jgi:hypothetical protein